jgi:citrate lyase beta subunit
MRARRALMYVPGDDQRKIEKAAGLGVDSLILDIEDGVALNRKDEAAVNIPAVLGSMDFGRSERLVRINPCRENRGEQDLEAILPALPDGIVIPKVETPEDLDLVCRRASAVEKQLNVPEGSIKLLALIETPPAFMNLKEICASCDRLEGLIFGAEDLAAGLGATRTAEGIEFLYARESLVMAAAAYGLQAVDLVTVEFRDLAVLERESRFGAQLGFTGKQIIHPAQVETVQAAFTPSLKEVEQAKALMEAFHFHQERGKGAFEFEGKMVDMPVIRRAQNILNRAGLEDQRLV